MKDEITFTKKEILKLYESLSNGMKLLAQLGRFSLRGDKEFNFLVEIYDDMEENRNRIREIEGYLSVLFLRDPDLFGERFESWLEQEEKSKKLDEMGKKK